MKSTFKLKELGKDLKSTRKTSKKSLRLAAKEMKVPHCTIHRIENGKHSDIHVSTLVKTCNWMKVDPMNYFKFVIKSLTL